MTKEEKAYQLLQHPEEYPSLVKRRASDRKLLLFRYPAFLAHASWSIFKTENDYWLRRVYWNRSNKSQFQNDRPITYASEVHCSSNLLEDLLSSLSLISCHPFARLGGGGRDGSIYGIIVSDRYLSCSLKWWDMATPDEWRILEQWCERAIESVETLLPESTYKLIY